MRIVLLLLATGWARAQFFPLQPGNQWIYRVGEGPVRDVRIAEVTRAETIDGLEYFQYRGIQGGTALLRMTAANKLVRRNADGTESLWVDFAASEGAAFATALEECTVRGRVESRQAKIELLDRRWEDGIQVAYTGSPCADAGVLEDVYLPGLGLARRTYQSFTGPRRYQLVYARIGNATVLTSGEYSFRIHLDQNIYPPRADIHLRLTLENRTKEPLQLVFNSGQSFDFAIRNVARETVYLWSANKLFPAVIREAAVTGEMSWNVTEAVDLKPGEYLLEGWLTAGLDRAFRAQVPFTVAVAAPIP